MGKGQVRVLTLELNVEGSKTLYRLKQGWTLQFRLGPSLLGRTVHIWTNCPLMSEGYDRLSYKVLKWESDASNKSDDTAIFANIHLGTSGSFHYHISDENEKRCGQGFFLVDPVLTVGSARDPLPLDSIQCQTIVTKNLGPFTGWEDKLRVSKESGYNMLHFTPLQVRGPSDSAYSLADMHDLDPQYECSWSDVSGLVNKIRDEWRMLSICDIVLNHASNKSGWIRQHPECTYNCMNCPHLRPAFLLDRVFYYCTVDIEEGRWVEEGIPKAEVSSQAHIDKVRELLFDVYLPEIKIEELFLIDVEKVLDQFEARVGEGVDDMSNPDGEIKIIQDPEYRRFGSTIDLDLAIKHYGHWKVWRDGLKKKLEELNQQKQKEIKAHLEAAVKNALSGAKWERLAADGPHITVCNPRNLISKNYFLGKPSTLAEEEQMMYTDEGKYFMAHNGWVMGLDPTTNFADAKCKVYFRRELIAWGDSVKLNYGNGPEDCPFLWDYMKKYVLQTAEVFHGIRLDNCHSTPIHVAEYLLDAAREINPNLYVIAELFTGSEASDNEFVNRLGISSLIREALSAWDSHEQGRLVHRSGNR